MPNKAANVKLKITYLLLLLLMPFYLLSVLSR